MAQYNENVLNVLALLKIKGIGKSWIVKNNSLDLEYLYKKTDLLERIEKDIKNSSKKTGNKQKNEEEEQIKEKIKKNCKDYFEEEKEKIKKKLNTMNSIKFITFKDDNFPLISQEPQKSLKKEKVSKSVEPQLFDELDEEKQGKRKPIHLKDTDFPVFLAYKGDLNLLAKKHCNIAVIGLLNPKEEIIELEKDIVKKFRDEGAVIVSGLALGCDTIAHKNAHKEATVAILPGTIENIIPKDNRELANEIATQGGLLMSEYYEEASDLYKRIGRFIERDRLQAMFSDMVVLTASYTEEDSKSDKTKDSGSRHAMARAKEYGIKRAVIFDEKLWFDEKTRAQFRLNKYLLLERFEEANKESLSDDLKLLREKIKKERTQILIEKISKEEYLEIIKFIVKSNDINDFMIIGRKNATIMYKKLKNEEN